mgnify:CR=1 FL=1
MNWKIIVGFIIFIDIFLPFILNLIDIPQNIYFNYLVFINALFLFYLLLPKRVGTMFV